MRKSVVLFLALILTQAAFAKMIHEKEEYTSHDMVKDFALERAYKRFLNVTKEYNKKRVQKQDFAQTFSDLNDRHRYLDWLAQNEVAVLPQANIKNGVAIIKVGKHEIQYSIKTLAGNYFLLNNKPVALKKRSFNESLKYIKGLVKGTKKVTLFDLIVGPAYADAMTRLENTLIATILYISHDFNEREWCITCADENLAVTQKNIDKLLSKMKGYLDSCENETYDVEEIYYQLDLFTEGDETAFRKTSVDRLKNFFPEITNNLKDVTCENMVYKAFSDKVTTGKGNNSGYWTTSVQRANGRAHFEESYKKLIQDKCNIVQQLNACMLNRNYAVRDVYDELRSPGDKEYSRRTPMSKTYKVRGISK